MNDHAEDIKCDDCREAKLEYYCGDCRKYLCIDCNIDIHQKGSASQHIRCCMSDRQPPQKDDESNPCLQHMCRH